jgi:hypothetical protein
LSSQRTTYSLGLNSIDSGENYIDDEGTQRAFAEAIAANPDIALVDLYGVKLSPNTDVLGVSDTLRDNHWILAYVQVQRIAQQRVKSAKSGAR